MISKGCLVQYYRELGIRPPAVCLVVSDPYERVASDAVERANMGRVMLVDLLHPDGRTRQEFTANLKIVSQ
jgi:hypothetical protein